MGWGRPGPVEMDTALSNESAVSDTTPPTLRSLVLEPAGGTQPSDPTITITVEITDEQAGNGDGGSGSPSQARLRSPSGQMRDALFVAATRVSGNANDGAYSQTFTLEEHAERGLWRVEYVLLVDAAGNDRRHDASELARRGFATSILVR